MEIADSARKHGIADEDIRHATRVLFRVVHQEPTDRVLVIGADRNGRLLELIVLGPGTEDETVIHADVLRPKFYDYL